MQWKLDVYNKIITNDSHTLSKTNYNNSLSVQDVLKAHSGTHQLPIDQDLYNIINLIQHIKKNYCLIDPMD